MKMYSFLKIVFTVLTGLLCVNVWAQSNETQIIYASPTGSGDGSSWNNAASFIDAATSARSIENHQIWLKAGTYLFTESINFDYLHIYGGFAGDEAEWNERNWHAHPAILDGNNSVSPLRNRTATTGAAIECVLDGVIVQNGLSSDANGGGMLANNGTIIRNCVFRHNETAGNSNGAAVHCQAGTVTIENCLFVNNTSAGNGGAIQIGGDATCRLTNCTLANNKSKGLGGAIGVGNNNSNCTLTNTIAYNNSSGDGSAYESYAQNSNINNGGTIISIHSAIESTSTKFSTDNNDENHITLSRSITPGFVEAASLIGKATNENEIAAANSASYALTANSICINKGKNSEGIVYDLAHESRIQGTSIDIGAYELPLESRIIYVSPTGNGDGSSWDNTADFYAAAQLVRTIDDQIWLKAGTYLFAEPVNFDYLHIYGGFAGDETEWNERNWHANPTILDGNNSVSPLRNRTATTGAAIECVLDGVIVQNGLSSDANGGGVFANNGTIIRNCIFRHNKTDKNGAAVHCQVGTVTIENCLFVNNTSTSNGGAIQIGGGATCRLTNCTLANNKATGLGGAIGVGNNSSNCILVNTLAYNNSSDNGSAYESYAQNNSINDGGTVVSIHSAIESTSMKFNADNSENHIMLSRSITPGFTEASSFIGKATNENEIATSNLASYALTAGSICIDAGKSSEAIDILYDLAYESRIEGESVDIGAYEFQSSIPTSMPAYSVGNIVVVVVGNGLYISGVEKGEQLNLFDIKGSLIHSLTINDENFTIHLKERGLYFVKVNEHVVKVQY